MNQTELAKTLGISKSYLSMILDGERKCPERLRGVLPMFTDVHKPKLDSAWEADILPLNYSRKSV